jgi:hypothetical protein
MPGTDACPTAGWDPDGWGADECTADGGAAEGRAADGCAMTGLAVGVWAGDGCWTDGWAVRPWAALDVGVPAGAGARSDRMPGIDACASDGSDPVGRPADPWAEVG